MQSQNPLEKSMRNVAALKRVVEEQLFEVSSKRLPPVVNTYDLKIAADAAKKWKVFDKSFRDCMLNLPSIDKQTRNLLLFLGGIIVLLENHCAQLVSKPGL